MIAGELVVFEQMPFLEGKSETLVLEELWVKLVVGLTGGEDNLIVVGALGVGSGGEFVGVFVRDPTNLEKEDLVR